MDKLCNGNCRTNTGYRQVSITTSGKVSPVLYGVFSGYIPDRATYQGVEPGDVVFCVEWDRRGSTYSAKIYGGEALTDEQTLVLWGLAIGSSPWLEDFLADTKGRCSSMLPIPETEWVSFVNRRRAADAFKKRFGDILPDISSDKKDGLKLRPRPIDFNTGEYIPELYQWDGSVVNIDQSESWYVSNGDGSSVMIETKPNTTSGSNYAHSDTSETEGEPLGESIPAGYKYLIRICYGAYTRNHYSYGHMVDVWQM